jgi:transcriptional regulator with XRE-family HTH domain
MRLPDAGVTIRTEMVRCGYTLESLSEETLISRAVLREILTGRAKAISTRNLCALARAFDYSASDFIDLLSNHARSAE